ncbi:MAG: GNAT family N-acetyltransferase [Archangium sp.]|nr:GNAT family N-acetyltransferase [Archangium sp.]
MKTAQLRPAHLADLPQLLTWMAEFNALEGIAFDRARTEPALVHLLADDKLGRVFVLTANDAAAGYAVITWGFDLEWAGRDAYLTELFLGAEFRRQGLGVRVMELLETEARGNDARALHLMVGETNHAAQRLYARRGFVQPRRLFLSKPLAA